MSAHTLTVSCCAVRYNWVLVLCAWIYLIHGLSATSWGSLTLVIHQLHKSDGSVRVSPGFQHDNRTTPDILCLNIARSAALLMKTITMQLLL